MDNKPKKPSAAIVEPTYLRGLASAAIVLTIIALLPIVFVHIIRILDGVLPDGISQSQGYWLLLPMLLINLWIATIVPLFGILSLIFSLVAFIKSKAQSSAHNRAIVGLILIGFGIIIMLPLLQDFSSILFG